MCISYNYVCSLVYHIITSVVVSQKWKTRWFVLYSDGGLSYFETDKVLTMCVFIVLNGGPIYAVAYIRMLLCAKACSHCLYQFIFKIQLKFYVCCTKGKYVSCMSTYFKHTFCNNFKQALGPGVLQTFSTCAVKP